MKSFSFMPDGVGGEFFYDVWSEISKLQWYFYKFTGNNADEAMQCTLMHVLSHFDSSKGNLSAYIKKLAREITKDNGRLIFVDFLEQTVHGGQQFGEVDSLDTGSIEDFSATVVNELDMRRDRMPEIIEIALGFMDKFMILCRALINHDTTTSYYPEAFIKACLKLTRKCPDFNSKCISLYRAYVDEFEWFLSLDDDNVGTWKETDYLLIQQCQSKRIKMVNSKTGADVVNADLEDWYLTGKFNQGGKKVIKVYYYDLWDKICDMIDDTETNEIKFIIGDIYIIRTHGGSLSIVNPDLFNLYDLVRMEILTNLLQVTNGRVLNVGSDNIYLLCNESFKPQDIHRVIKGLEINLQMEDITSTVSD